MEKMMKRWFKRRTRVTLSTLVAFLLSSGMAWAEEEDFKVVKLTAEGKVYIADYINSTTPTGKDSVGNWKDVTNKAVEIRKNGKEVINDANLTEMNFTAEEEGIHFTNNNLVVFNNTRPIEKVTNYAFFHREIFTEDDTFSNYSNLTSTIKEVDNYGEYNTDWSTTIGAGTGGGEYGFVDKVNNYGRAEVTFKELNNKGWANIEGQDGNILKNEGRMEQVLKVLQKIDNFGIVEGRIGGYRNTVQAPNYKNYGMVYQNGEENIDNKGIVLKSITDSTGDTAIQPIIGVGGNIEGKTIDNRVGSSATGNLENKIVNSIKSEASYLSNQKTNSIKNSIINRLGTSEKKWLDSSSYSTDTYTAVQIENNTELLEINNSIINGNIIKDPNAKNVTLKVTNGSIVNGQIGQYDDEKMAGSNLNSRPTGEYYSTALSVDKLVLDNTVILNRTSYDYDNEEEASVLGVSAVEIIKNESMPDRKFYLPGMKGVGEVKVKAPTALVMNQVEAKKMTVSSGGSLYMLALQPQYVDDEDVTIKSLGAEGSGKIVVMYEPFSAEIGKEYAIGANLNSSVNGVNDSGKKVNLRSQSQLHSVEVKEPAAGKLRNRFVLVEKRNLPDLVDDETPANSGNSGGASSLDYNALDQIYQGIQTSGQLSSQFLVMSPEQKLALYQYLDDIYSKNPYSYSVRSSQQNLALFRELAIQDLNPNLKKWAFFGGLVSKDGIQQKEEKVNRDMRGMYAQGEYRYAPDATFGFLFGGANTKLNSELGKVKSDAMYMSAYAKKEHNHWQFLVGTSFQHTGNKGERNTISYAGITSSRNYKAKYDDNAWDIYARAKYSKDLGKGYVLEPALSLAYSRIAQKAIQEDKQALSLHMDGKSFSAWTTKAELDLKKKLQTGKAKQAFVAGISYERMLSGTKAQSLQANMGAQNFAVQVPKAEKGQSKLALKYEMEHESGFLFDTGLQYRIPTGNQGKEWTVGLGAGYKFK